MTATSGSYDFKVTALQIMQAACEDLGLVADSVAIGAPLSTKALIRLNLIAKQWQGRADGAGGIKFWSLKRLTMLFANGQQTYTIGPASSDSRASTAVGRTTISADEALGQTVLSITSNTDTTSYPGTTITMTAADIIGIELNDGTIQWTTISGTPSSTATVVASLTAAASAGRYVWWFTARAQRFPTIETAVLRDENRKDMPIEIYRTLEDYEYGVADKYADGDPTAILVEPGLLNTKITLDAQPSSSTIKKTLQLAVLYPAEDYDATTDDIAFPQEWFRPLKWELMLELSAGKDWTKAMWTAYGNATAMAKNLNPEMSNAYFQCNA